MSAPAARADYVATRCDAVAAARAALAAAAGGEPVALVTVVRAPPGSPVLPGARFAIGTGVAAAGSAADPALEAAVIELGEEVLAAGRPIARAVSAASGSHLLYAEPQRAPESLVVVGAGHIAVPLVRLGAMAGFRVTVLDDREDFATPERFPDAARVVRADFSDPFRGIGLGPHSYIVLVTRGHRYDFDCLGQLLEAGARVRYIGLIGSRRRVRAAFRALLDAGYPRDRLATIRAPVGVDIGAETPEEIAISIAAELVLVRRGGPEARMGTLTERENVLSRLLPE